VSSRRDAVPFDTHYFEKLRARGNAPSNEAIFRDIYQRNHWSGQHSPSGAGASPDQTRALGVALPVVLRRLGVDVLLDLPCGDYSWMRRLELPVAQYIGADLLPEIIRPLQEAYTDVTHRFVVLDLTSDPLPQADLLLCRDCLVHLSFDDTRRALRNLARSGIPHLLITTFPECEVNEDIVTGDWRPLNLENEPFCFPPPSQLLNERCTEAGGRFADKSLGLWQVADLTGLPFVAV
jgi:Methyltransferase domain